MTKAKIKKEHLKLLFDSLKISHRIIGPKVEGNVIVLAEIANFHDIPAGYKEQQGRGTYRLGNPPSPPFNKGGITFSFSVGPDSFKRFVSPPVRENFAFKKSKKGISVNTSENEKTPMAFIGMRACDMAALRLLDKVFLEGPIKDAGYDSLRRNSLIVGVNCLSPGDNCFCSSMDAGPEMKEDFDIAITELDDSFLLEIGTVRGREILNALPLDEVNDKDLSEKVSKIENCKKMIKKSIKVSELPWLIYRNLEHPRWTDVAGRCLACGNCTQVCPTCFCNSSYDHLTLSGISKKLPELSGARIRTWDSCFSINFARVHGGNFRPSRRARYRQWMSHKLSYWIDQFGLPGCVGCGRCITWCPVGIDITQELEALHVR